MVSEHLGANVFRIAYGRSFGFRYARRRLQIWRVNPGAAVRHGDRPVSPADVVEPAGPGVLKGLAGELARRRGGQSRAHEGAGEVGVSVSTLTKSRHLNGD